MKISTSIVSAALAIVLAAAGGTAGTLGIGTNHDLARAEIVTANGELRQQLADANFALTALDQATYDAAASWTGSAERVLDTAVRDQLALELERALDVRDQVAATAAEHDGVEAVASVWPWENVTALERVALAASEVEPLDNQADAAAAVLGAAITAVDQAVSAWEAEQERIAAEAAAAAEAARIAAEQAAAAAEARARAAAQAPKAQAQKATPAPQAAALTVESILASVGGLGTVNIVRGGGQKIDCGRPAWGCFDFNNNSLRIASGLTGETLRYVTLHEYAHSVQHRATPYKFDECEADRMAIAWGASRSVAHYMRSGQCG